MPTGPGGTAGRRVALLVSAAIAWPLALAGRWAAAGDDVTVVLLDTAVAAARAGHTDAVALRAAADSGIALAAEQRALQRRGLRAERLLEEVKVMDLDEVADLLAEGVDKVLWL